MKFHVTPTDHWKVCAECGGEFTVGPSSAERRRKYCSPACRAEANRRNALGRYYAMTRFDFEDGGPKD
jgi:hypothetical protein